MQVAKVFFGVLRGAKRRRLAASAIEEPCKSTLRLVYFEIVDSAK